MEKIRALIIEDDENDIHLLLNVLKKNGYTVESKTVQNKAELEAAFEDGNLWDIVYSDFHTPKMDCFDNLRFIAEKSKTTPVIIVSGTIGEERAIDILKAGARDYVMKDNLKRLASATKNALNDVATQRNLATINDQFEQAQRLEIIGRFAGGMAHDYNNMLTVILGNAELALINTDLTSSLHTNLERIIEAARHSTDITRKLLAFARKQTIIPVALDLNLTVKSMLKMLRHLIGEDINLTWLPGADAAPIKMDPVQIDQILANLCINARDAITDVGKITIETGNAVFDEIYCADHVGYVAGEYTMLAVSDNGCGMKPEMLAQIFEPFFTSKGLGQGTGLGLSTVYGIVKQNQGFINVYSEPGSGTTFRIYLPRCDGPVVHIQSEKTAEIPLGHGETVLLVEDEPALLELGKRMLERLGYLVLAAATPAEGIGLAAVHASELHLLITDVVMPEMNGPDLAKHLQALHSGLKVLFMSGFTADIIASRGVLDEGTNFIQKPFSMKELAIKVQEVRNSAA